MKTKQSEEQRIREWLIQRAAQQLEVPPRSIDGSAALMSLGIDSLDLIGIAGEIAEFLNRDIRAEVLWECETIDGLAEFLASPASLGQVGNLVPRTPENRQCYLVEQQQGLAGVRPVIGVGFRNVSTLAAAGLPTEVPVQTVVGLVDGQATTVRSISTIATDSVLAITERYATGAVTLVGFSWCGFLAYEIACQLAEMGCDVWLYLLEPAPFASRDPQENSANKIRRHAAVLSEKTGMERVRYCIEKAGVVRRNVVHRASRRLLAPLYLRRLRSGKTVPGGFRWDTIRPSIENRICEHERSVFAGPAKLFGRSSWLDLHASAWSDVLSSGEAIELLGCTGHHHCAVTDRQQNWVDVLAQEYACELCVDSGWSTEQVGSSQLTVGAAAGATV